jgi:Ca2+-binding RTX toxin-like protein
MFQHNTDTTGCGFESLEARQLLSAVPAAVMNAAGFLRIIGTRNDDTVVMGLRAGDASTLDVTVNGTTKSFAVADIKLALIVGGNGNDTFTVDETNGAIAFPVVMIGGNGSDSLTGGSGNDFFIAGNGNDTVNGGAGDDRVIGANGDDQLNGGDGDDLIAGANGDDAITGGNGNDKLIGGNGGDSISGDDGNDIIVAGPSVDSVTTGNGADTVYGGLAIEITDASVDDTLVGVFTVKVKA